MLPLARLSRMAATEPRKCSIGTSTSRLAVGTKRWILAKMWVAFSPSAKYSQATRAIGRRTSPSPLSTSTTSAMVPGATIS